MSRQTALWVLAALLGLMLTAGITWATSQLTSQHIGLSSEPISGGRRLAPAVTERSAPRRTTTRKRSAPSRRSTTSTGSKVAPSEPTVSQIAPAPSSTTVPSSPSSSSTSSSTSAKRTTTRRRTGSTRDDSGGDSGGSREAGTPAGRQSPSHGRDD
ncbi:MAG TPA: hypothetical protein VLJ80_14135 [Solirubrobacteraceae bacterium]|nr:hypothetical protein [Solirubrobacteraceae bacterium]